MIDTQYFSPDDISTQLITSSENYFSVLHVNIRSISKNFEKLKDLLANINFKFKIINASLINGDRVIVIFIQVPQRDWSLSRTV